MLTPELATARWRGVVAPLVTPFAADGALDLASLRANVRWLLDRGARQGNTILLVGGSGGDFTAMNLDERLQVIRAVAEVAAGQLPIIAGAQSLDIRDSIAICRLCEELGVDAVQISGPFYYDGRPDDVVAWMEEVARHTGIGFAIYNNWYTGYDMPLDLIERLLELPNSIGVKWSSPHRDTFVEGVRRFAPRAAVVDNTLDTIAGHLAGCRAFVSHFPNFYPEFCWRIWELMEAFNYHQAQQEFDRLMVPYRALVSKIASQTAGEGVFVRPAMAAVGLNGGHSRPPSRDSAVTPELRQGFKTLLAEASDAGRRL
ncbi:MAG TPA: dihydrodipicolinate synthase family protein [Chloroflexota bacterium]|nr:dihydrodipicolinate synthase family protein [Chloroflexota bacterium]